MANTYIPAGYKAKLSVYETQRAIDFIKRCFQRNLSSALHLKRVSAPLFVTEGSGLNDNLNGVSVRYPLTCRQSVKRRRSSILSPSGSGSRSKNTNFSSATACIPI